MHRLSRSSPGFQRGTRVVQSRYPSRSKHLRALFMMGGLAQGEESIDMNTVLPSCLHRAPAFSISRGRFGHISVWSRGQGSGARAQPHEGGRGMHLPRPHPPPLAADRGCVAHSSSVHRQYGPGRLKSPPKFRLDQSSFLAFHPVCPSPGHPCLPDASQGHSQGMGQPRGTSGPAAIWGHPSLQRAVLEEIW